MDRISRGVLGLVIAAAIIGIGVPASASAATFPVDPATLGVVPDDAPTMTPKDFTFDVSGFSGPPTDVSLTLAGNNTYVSDLDVVLIAPDGVTKRTIFSATGLMVVTGDTSNWAGPYTFSDSAPASPTWWEAAATAGPSDNIPAGSYRASNGGFETNPGANALITPAFAGLANPNGTWTMRIRDFEAGNLITISAASLSITAGAPAAPSLTSTDPASPAASVNPKVKGTAAAGTQVRLYSTAACTGAPLATGTPAELSGAGIAVTVPANATTQIRATATNTDSQVSACSAPLSYTTPAPAVDPPVTPPNPDPADTSAPETTIKRQPTRTGPNHSHFAFRSSEPSSTFRCSLDKATFRDCKSPKDYKNLDKGKHVFRVVATDTAGNTDASPARLKFKIGS